MVSQLENNLKTQIIYPEQDGNPMSDNTVQFRWITTIKDNLEWLFSTQPEVFVAGDLLWYPVEGNNKLRQAPDIMVVFGALKGDRGSYKQWLEDNIPPQVVFEILSPGNRQTEMNKKQLFYERYGVEEYYIYDPDKNDLSGWLRGKEGLDIIENLDNWVSPRLGIRFQLTEPELSIYYPDGQPFSTYHQERRKVEQERRKVEQERRKVEQERRRAEKLALKLRELGINSEEV